jgi:peptidylprolyl isomerase
LKDEINFQVGNLCDLSEKESNVKQKAAAGDTVRVHYVGTLDNGVQFDASLGSDPLEFTVGTGQVIPGFDAAIEGMEIGESKQVRIDAENAYGPHHEEMVLQVPRAQLPVVEDLQVGQQVQMKQGEHNFYAVIQDVDDETVTFDANHPLAGETLVFELELVEII